MHIQSAKLFRKFFSSNPDVIVQSPGRVNIIGEHTDYNEGFVLPAAIDKFIFIAVQKREDQKICLYSTEFNEYLGLSLQNLVPSKAHWSNYVLGVLHQLIKRGYFVSGVNVLVDGN